MFIMWGEPAWLQVSLVLSDFEDTIANKDLGFTQMGCVCVLHIHSHVCMREEIQSHLSRLFAF